MKFLNWLASLDTRQWIAGSRQWISFIAGALATIGLVSATQSQDLIKHLGDLVAGATQLVAALGVIATAAVALINSIKAMHNSSKEVAVQRVQEIAQDPAEPVSRDAKAALVTAAVSLPEVKSIQIAPADSSTEAKAEVVALNAATPSSVVMNPIPQTQ